MKTIVLILFCFSLRCFAQTGESFSINCIESINNTDTIILKYEVKNISGKDASILYNPFYRCPCNKGWNLNIQDSLNRKYEFDWLHKGSLLTKEDYIKFKKDSVLTITYKLAKNDFVIYIPTSVSKKYPYQRIDSIKYPLEIILKYKSEGEYWTSRGKKKKLEGAQFNCKSESFIRKE